MTRLGLGLAALGRPGYINLGHAADLLRGLLRDVRDRPQYRLELAKVRLNQGNLFAPERKHEAEAAYQEALGLTKRLAEDFPARLSYARELANVHNSYAALVCGADDLGSARTHWRAARAVWERLLERDADAPDYRGQYGVTLFNLGWLYARERNWDEARRHFARSTEELRRALTPNPSHPDFVPTLRSAYRALAETRLQLGDAGAAADAAEASARVGNPNDAESLYAASLLLARCAGADPGERYARSSLELLTRAVQSGFADKERLDRDRAGAFAAVAARPEFDRLCAELAAPPGGAR